MSDGIATLIAYGREEAEQETLLAARMAALQGVAYPVGSPHKRFARDIAGREASSLSKRQRDHVARLCWRYRKQIAERLVPPRNPDA